MNFQLTIHTDSTPFEEDMRGELQRLMDFALDEFMNSYSLVPDDKHKTVSLIDANGATCGSAKAFGNKIGRASTLGQELVRGCFYSAFLKENDVEEEEND